ncbi:hypothetical protein [Candidatus Similichlamydia laticola]|uniref:Uncharacterized protein n=1 Tax=Candidatus Similichlamydia laticola TaxID=2170265 RepID=A0A369KAQ3_9BACT|nr:hypothetical protein [Candidatus Similichlamydia laticola]RDB31689.1 hypothetical protein HAT2_00198 [Candidatus Similichlamydia laticola]
MMNQLVQCLNCPSNTVHLGFSLSRTLFLAYDFSREVFLTLACHRTALKVKSIALVYACSLGWFGVVTHAVCSLLFFWDHDWLKMRESICQRAFLFEKSSRTTRCLDCVIALAATFSFLVEVLGFFLLVWKGFSACIHGQWTPLFLCVGSLLVFFVPDCGLQQASHRKDYSLSCSAFLVCCLALFFSQLDTMFI